jgi:dipeptidyl aminopeptidase/acylaminoacyl peptidase
MLASLAYGQGTLADYQRARDLREKLQGLTADVAGPATWIEGTTRFWYRKTVEGGDVFVVGDSSTRTKRPAFDHEKLAAALGAAAGEAVKPLAMPFQQFTFTDKESAIQFTAFGSTWRCGLAEYSCRKQAAGPGTGPQSARRPPSEEPENDVADGMVGEAPQQGPTRGGTAAAPEVRASPDGKWEALIRNFNVLIRAKGKTEAELTSHDGSEGNYYTLNSLAWSPDSLHLVAYRVRPGYRREVHYVESSPADQLQPKHSSREYAKPGDPLDIARPVLFHVGAKQQVEIDNADFANPYGLTRAAWWKDSRGFTFEYNQRGHQLYRVIEVDAASGRARTLMEESSKTFVDYRPLIPNPRDTGKKFRQDLADGKEMVWASERDGWEHLYLVDGATGKVKQQITRGPWVVRAVDKVDEAKREIWFQASGMDPSEDPYFVHSYRIRFDGTGLTPLTPETAEHTVRFSPDMSCFVDTYSRVDLPTVSVLRSSQDGTVLMELERGQTERLTAAGWRPPEVFSAPGRDGKTAIWGLIYKPLGFDASKKYPVVESVYAGPQGSFVPKGFAVHVQPLAELGFIVVQIDGMGTNNRSRAFHDVAWRNLADGGFPDRILWHRAVAAKYPWYDITRVGVFGTSAGGQNALAALLFHPEFYHVAVSNSGCHDNRMDKIWWNEQWMGWPLGPHYAASSNVDNAVKLQGKLLLVVGEMDTNVDPASTLQVANALIKASKKFDLLYVPGGGHGAGGAYGQRLLQDFFVHHLLGVEPPDWNLLAEKEESQRRQP